MKAPRAAWLLTFENVDVTDELTSMSTSIEYTDNTEGTSDELSITVEDRKGRWRTGWFPSEGDRLSLQLGWEGEPLLDCGSFKVDEVEITGVPDTVSIRALAAQSAQPVRTVQYRSFEATTLRELMSNLAVELGLAFEGDVEDIPILRATQGETTLAFLRRLAMRYGYAFSLRSDRIQVYELVTLEQAPPVLALERSDLLPGFRFKSKAAETYAACELTYLDPWTKETRVARVEEQNARQAIVLGASAGGEAETVPLPTRTLRLGISGDDVRDWQTFVRSKAIEVGPLDGIFGPKTRAGTMNFQKGAGLKVDGIVGAETLRAAVSAGFGTTPIEGTHAETAGNVLRITRRAESADDATRQARAALNAANRLKVTGSLDVIGRTRLVAGANLELAGMGRISGKFNVTKSTHRVDRSGAYTTSAEVNGV